MDKDQYILRMLTKTSKKRWEFFVVSRVIHLLNDPEIEFITQQLVRRSNGRRALTDMYFPQFGIHLEIDEGQHLDLMHAEADKQRTKDIVSVTGGDLYRIKAAEKDKNGSTRALQLRDISDETDEFIKKIKALKAEAQKAGTFQPWDFEGRYKPSNYARFNTIRVGQNVLLRKQAHALWLFGYEGGDYQRGTWKIPNRNGDFIWFPRLYKQKNWDNSLSDDGLVITERPLNEEVRYNIANSFAYYKEDVKRIVFARATNALGQTLYRYVGTFMFNHDKSSPELSYFDRISSEEKISPPDSIKLTEVE